uniref:DUF3782 domain-containing protein n=2 Tax=Candidatus Kentrum sp. UNK TaxID=2126344 RepID=A0A451B388_9GAMM|nr:MAG: hypothetical protein BECKUNK1418H_GA0071006_11379 [Candidatus Kentron sp. UNK]
MNTQQPTPESVWIYLQEIGRRMEETDRKMQETDRLIKETNKQTAKRMRKTDEQMRETDRLIKETSEQMRETDRKMQETDRRLKKAEDLFTTQWGRLMESLVSGSLIRIFNEQGISVDDTSSRVKGNHAGRSYEFDIIVHNGKEIIIVEVKTTLRPDDVREFLDKLDSAKTWMPRYKDNVIYGAMAWLQANAGADRMVANRKLFSIQAVGDSARLANDSDFKPRAF